MSNSRRRTAWTDYKIDEDCHGQDKDAEELRQRLSRQSTAETDLGRACGVARPGWDPLGLADESELDSLVSKLEPPLPAEDTTFDWTIVAISREVELKNGRSAMFACLGYIMLE
ncbi:unnamed protein product [Durusdinium trenchii]|uniref:Uncharacterized protein n=2 Tax=Durusdinium trenchii TaxID=1381693 RepID=A0ABP0JI59_9DINO|eukprot:g8500.t1